MHSGGQLMYVIPELLTRGIVLPNMLCCRQKVNTYNKQYYPTPDSVLINNLLNENKYRQKTGLYAKIPVAPQAAGSRKKKKKQVLHHS